MTSNPPPIKRPLQVNGLFRTHSEHIKKPTALRSNSSSTHTLLSPVKGYDDMEAQFAWDDKTIRQTFIRKVRLPPETENTRSVSKAVLIACSSSHRSTPSSWRSCWSRSASWRSSPSGNSTFERTHLFLHPGWNSDWNPFASAARLWGSTSRPTLACTWRLSEWNHSRNATSPWFLVLYDIWSPDLIAASCSLQPISRCLAVESWGEPAFHPGLHNYGSSVEI